MINCTHVSYIYPGGGGIDTVDFQVSKGEFVVLQGPTGAGKSTLFRLLTAEIFPKAGQVRVGKIVTSTASRTEISNMRKQIGIVFQDGKLLPDRDCIDNVAFGLWVRGVPSRRIKPQALKILLDVGLAKNLHKRPQQLSGGEQQRLAIARALVSDPLVLLADEPLAHLDPESAHGIIELLTRVNRRGTAVVMASHRLDGITQAGVRVVKMLRGRIVN